MPTNSAKPDFYCPVCGALFLSEAPGSKCPNQNCPDPFEIPEEPDAQTPKTAELPSSPKPIAATLESEPPTIPKVVSEMRAHATDTILPQIAPDVYPDSAPKARGNRLSITEARPMATDSGGWRRKFKAMGYTAIVLLAATLIIYLAFHESARDESRLPVRMEPQRGTLQVMVNIPSHASLDGWEKPDGHADRPSTLLVFSNVMEGTHTLDVWAGSTRETRRISIIAGRMTPVRIELPVP